MSDSAIEILNLSHRYPAAAKSQRWALRDVSLTVRAGSVFALLGPNGAGKTTMVKILSTLLIPTAGSARVLSHDVVREVSQVRRDIGLALGGERGLYDRLSAYDNLRYFAELYGIGGSRGRRRIDEVLELVGLTGDRDKRVEQFSRGMKQRLHIGRGILHEPRVLLLDEPTIGVDPVGARKLRSLVQHLNAQGTSILLTTHYMHEAEQLADSAAILRGGHVVVCGTPKEVRMQARVQAVIEAVSDGISDRDIAFISSNPLVTGVDISEHLGRQRLTIGVAQRDDVSADEITRALESHDVRVTGLRDASLEDAYVEFVAGDHDKKTVHE